MEPLPTDTTIPLHMSFSNSNGSKDAAILLNSLALSSDQWFSIVLWVMKRTQATEARHQPMPGLASVYPSWGWEVEVINKTNKIILSVHTEVITNIFGIQLTMF
jgi:hypothetical protein